MREIKFRGKDKDSGEWICGSLLCLKAENIQIWRKEKDGTWNYVVDPATVGQYTGLCDKNGVEIYEGDIVDTMALGMFEVIFDCGAFRIAHGCIKFTMIEGSYYEVVGSVHDAPELLKK